MQIRAYNPHIPDNWADLASRGLYQQTRYAVTTTDPLAAPDAAMAPVAASGGMPAAGAVNAQRPTRSVSFQ